MIEELENLFYDTFFKDSIELKISEYEEDNKIIYKNENNLASDEKILIRNYASKYELKDKQIDTLYYMINQYIWNSTIIEVQNNIRLDLKKEADDIYKAIETLQQSKIFKSIEPNYDDCYEKIINRYNALANDLYNLSNEKITNKSTSDIDEEYSDNSQYIHTKIRKYPNLNKRIVLCAFKQSKNGLTTELLKSIIRYIQSEKDIVNNKETQLTKKTKELLFKLFYIKINDRDISNTNQYLSTMRHNSIT
jgi:ribosomal protein L31E